MIDVHCHLNLHAFDSDFDEVIKHAEKTGVTTIINVGTSIPSSRKAIQLAHSYKNLYAIVGIHPHHADKLDKEFEGELPENWYEDLKTLATQKKVVAIGEVGLDYYMYKSNGIVEKELQKKVFIQQIELAHELKLPLQIHNRHAGSDILDILEAHKTDLQQIPGMFHCFAGDYEILKRTLNLGFYIGFDGNITYKGLAPGETVSLSDLAKQTPLNRIVTETDSPFLTPIPHRGGRNIPSYVILIGEFLAKLKGISYEKMAEITTQNAHTVFKLNDIR